MDKKEPTQQAKRFKEFFKKTGYTGAAFARECNIASVRSVTKIINDGNTPTTKFLDKIKKRFPMLNTDYIMLGFGNMMLDEELNLHFQGTEDENFKSLYDALDKEEEEDNKPFTSQDGEMLWDRVDALEKRLSHLERRISKRL